MPDLVGTCPKTEWKEWLLEGDCAGSPETGQEYGWYTRHRLAKRIKPGDRFYVVAHGKLRGYAIVAEVQKLNGGNFAIIRKGGAVACTIPEEVPGFRGLRLRWWDRSAERPFPGWKSESGQECPSYKSSTQTPDPGPQTPGDRGDSNG